MLQIFVGTNYDFLGKRKIAYIVSASIIIAGIISMILKGGLNYGIDFTGGTAIRLKFSHDISIGEFRSSLGKIGLAGAEIKNFGVGDEVLIRIQEQEKGSKIVDDIKTRLAADFPQNPFEVRGVEKVGPKIGSELRRAAVWAMLIAMALILVYITLRFELKYAVGCVVPLFHDVLVTLAFLSFLNYEISIQIVGALLTIIGYSLNDTIVTFDRVRENLKILRRETLERILNISVNETLSRTIITNFTVLMVVIILFAFGGDVIRSFAFALLVGSITGTYSTVYVAGPLVLEWAKRQEQRKLGGLQRAR